MFRQRILMWGLVLLVAFLLGSATSSEALPDLVITNLQGPTTVNLGDYFSIFATVKNQGISGSGPFRLVFYFSSDSTINSSDYLIPPYSDIYYCRSQGLEPGEEFPCGNLYPIFWCPYATPVGIYYLGAIVDDQNQVAESNENNNTRVADTGLVAVLSTSGPEFITTPNTPAGPANGTIMTTYIYSAQGAISSIGHSV